MNKYETIRFNELQDRVKKLETLIPAIKQSIRAVTIPEANDALIALTRTLMEVEPEYFISMNKWLANPTFDDVPETD